MRKAIAAISIGLSILPATAGIVNYPVPAEARTNPDFTVSVRQEGTDWLTIPSYNVMVDEVRGTRHTVSNSSMAYFDFSGQVEVKVRNNRGPISEARVRPTSHGIATTVEDSTLTFTIDRPRLLSVEVNGDIFANLQLFANPIDPNAPTPQELKKLRKNRNYIYLGPGYHKFDTLTVKSGQTVYVAGGAYVDGVVEITDAEDVRLLGRGMIYPYRKMGVQVRRSRRVEINGIFTTQCAIGGSDSVTVSNVKVMSYYGWGDGFNIFASSNVHYNGIFARTSDDCTTVYATRKGYSGGCTGILTENAVLWADVAHPFMIGIHGCVERPDTISNITYRNIDVLDMQEKQIDYQGVFAIIAGDNNYVRDVTFDNIRVENFRQGKLIDIRIPFNKKYCGAPGSAIENINFKDITYNGDRSELSMIIGYDETRKIKGVHFENLVINGTKITDDMPGKPGWYKTGDMGRIFIGEHVEDVTFR